jgi:hypothetical protein
MPCPQTDRVQPEKAGPSVFEKEKKSCGYVYSPINSLFLLYLFSS